MSERFNAKKEIEDLAIMTSNSFTIVFDSLGKIAKNFDNLQEDVNETKNDLKTVNKKLDLILANIVTRYEFENHLLNHK